MASLEHVCTDGRDSFKLRITLDRKRYKIGLGAFDESKAIEAKEHIEHIIGRHKRNRPPSSHTSDWLDTLPASIHDRLAAIGLVEARKRCELPRTVVAYMRAYIKTRTDWKKPENYNQAVDHLRGYLKRDAPISSLTMGDVERWQRWMIDDSRGPKLSANTAGQNVKRCRQIMRQAVNDGLVDRNPFEGVKIDLRSDPKKQRFITAAETVAILDACPDQEWRVIVALARYGGLRCPSETLGLRWSDINWERGRFIVTAPKTERYGKGERVPPLFPELREELDSLYQLAMPGVKCSADAFVIQRYRQSETNLRTTFGKIVKRAGVKAFPKPFVNLRSSARTERERSGRHANHVLNDWFGHSAEVAETYYLQTTEDDYADAIQGCPHTSAGGTCGGTSLTGREPSQAIKSKKKPRKTGLGGAVTACDIGKSTAEATLFVTTLTREAFLPAIVNATSY
ncbi:tyrosine-type recombinase/integrase [Crateriforma conspicua]|uniref:Phage integrase family protein n=1 Tax=Crateriforma conspicua TaxID=2527996 RepID=A0A5C6FNC4_9PLAN|nr:site-specific integrase [Crateriforma conspicua]TWU64622.1 Phage integrase family protein [Crateriforma conspicua]